MLGVSNAAISRWENGSQHPGFLAVEAVAAKVGLKPGQLDPAYGREGQTANQLQSAPNTKTRLKNPAARKKGRTG